MYKHLERYAQLGGFIQNLSDEIHQVEVQKIDEEGKNSTNNQKIDESKEDISGNQDKNEVEQSMLPEHEPLFVDPNSKQYLNRDNSTLQEEEKSRIS
jgi:hypothetical protein